MTGEKTLNIVIKMLEPFLKIHKNIRISILRRKVRHLYKKKNFKPEIKPMIENLRTSNLQKRIYKKPYTQETTSKAPTTEFLSKIPNRKKISNEDS